eukprot:gnl/TRDRNA2_/TRDRNA2_176286_c3_seq8.p1 gnl/TRDRNA2_/TRDRNA2_176286_c3~~gnl/TRDRNA2_/TRDRNA2_176286_c3_seq8.p1  ORF type:complete len:189 (+),score=19.32 gnl/TRDRNA2_/TRDRNA2_176286_c3_seq8:1-567(+)
MRNLLIAGTVLGKLTVVTFHARNSTAPFLIGLGDHLIWLPDGKITESALSHYVQMQAPGTNVSITITPDKPGSPEAIHVSVGMLTVTVRRPHVPEGQHWQFLNMEVTGLDSLQYPIESIGGALGIDSPSGAKGKAKWYCARAKRKSKPRIISEHVVALAESPDSTVLQEVSIDGDADFDHTIDDSIDA